MPKLVIRVAASLKDKIARAAEDKDMLPSEWVREVLRESFESDNEPGDEGNETGPQ